MAMGIPLICNDIGDTGRIIEDSGAGILVKHFESGEYEKAVEILPGLLNIDKTKIRNAAFKYYDLTTGVLAYTAVYKQMANN